MVIEKRLLTIFVPVLNERATVRGAVESLLKVDFPIDVEVIIVDDGSTDGSLDVVSDLIDQSTVRAITHPRNRGKGASLQTALAQANGDVFTVFDADMESNPDDLNTLLEAILIENVAVAYGKRSFGAHNAYSFWYVMGNRFLGFFTSFIFNTWISDIETCFKMASTDTWKSLNVRSKGFGVEAEVTGKLLRSGYVIHELPIHYSPRTRKAGKKIKWTDGLAALGILLLVRLLPRQTWARTAITERSNTIA